VERVGGKAVAYESGSQWGTQARNSARTIGGAAAYEVEVNGGSQQKNQAVTKNQSVQRGGGATGRERAALGKPGRMKMLNVPHWGNLEG